MVNQNEANELLELKTMFSDYQKKQSQSTNRKSTQSILAKFFTPRNTKEVFRILPPKAGRKHIEEAFFHQVTTNVAGGKIKHGTKIYCPAHNDKKVPKLGPDNKPLLDSNGQPMLIPAPCPLCAAYKSKLSEQDPSLKGIKKENMNDLQKKVHAKNLEIYKEAIKLEAKKFYIVRGIDKGQQKDGVKFWRFKHNYKNQGTLDKLLPILEDYMTVHKADFSNDKTGTDLTIIMTDSEFNGHTYKSISAITARGKSPLHEDSIVMRGWLDDDIIWRDVFLPKRAPNTTPYEFLEMLVSGTNPYWDDIDQSNKRWVFPGRPDLEEKANTRTLNLDNEDKKFEQATDLEELPRVTISNITSEKVGTYTDDATNLGNEMLEKATTPTPTITIGKVDDLTTTNSNDESESEYDDLPF